MRKGNVVYKYDLKGNFICSYLNTTQAARDTNCNESTIRRHANNDGSYGGFIWSRVRTEEFAKYYQGFGYNKRVDFDVETLISTTPHYKDKYTCIDVSNGEASYININKNILVIGDLHAPFIREGYLEFCKEIYLKYQCTDVVFIGDILDSHFSSFWTVAGRKIL